MEILKHKKVLAAILAVMLLAGCSSGGRPIKDEKLLSVPEETFSPEITGFGAKELAKEAIAKMANQQAAHEATETETAYEQAMQLLEEENYEAAIVAFTELGDYKDSATRLKAAEEAIEAEAAKAETDKEQVKTEPAQPTVQQEAQKETDAKAVWEAEHPEKVVQADGMYHIYEYYPNGLVKSDFLYNVDGSNFNSFEYEYDSAGREIRETKKIGGKFYSSVGTEYDSAGRVSKRTWYHEDGTVSWYVVDEYNSAGQTVKDIFYNGDGSVDWYRIYEYNSIGQQVKQTSYNADGTVSDYGISEYDNAGKCVKTTFYYADGTVKFTSTY